MECYYYIDVSRWDIVYEGSTFQIRKDMQGSYWLVLRNSRAAAPTIAVEISSAEMEGILQSREPDEEAKRIAPKTHHYVHVRQ